MRKYIPVRNAGAIGKVYLDEIIYIRKELRKAVLVTCTEQITFYCEMAELKRYTDERFLDCHRSYLFNMDRITYMKNQTVYMDKDCSVLLGRECFRRGKRIFSNYMIKDFT